MSGDAPAAGSRATASPRRPLASIVALVVLGATAVLWTVVFVRLGLLRHDRFGTFGFDLGIYDQGVWLLSEGRTPFVTVRGIDLLGHHANLTLYLLAPLYRLGGGPGLLLVVQAAVQATGAVAVYLLARDRVGPRSVALVLAAVLLLNPTYQWLVWEFFHPDALAIAPLLFTYWLARTHRWGWCWVAAAVTVLTKEDAALAVAVIGVLVAFRGERRRGVALAGAASAWFVVATRVIIPWRNGIGPFYDSFFGELGDSPVEIGWNAISHPFRTLGDITQADHRTWYVRMLAPFAALPLLALPTFAIAAPMIAVNVLTAYPYTRDYRFHYSAIVVAAGILATVEAVAWAEDRRPGTGRVLAAVALAAALLTTVLWGASPLARDYDAGIWPLQDDPRVAVKEAAVAAVPEGAATSAIFNLVPHLTHRERIYEFPVPWCNVNWGVDGEGLDDPDEVEYLALDRRLLGEEDRALLARLLEREFEVRFQRDDMLVAERVHPADPPLGPAHRPGECRAPLTR